MQRTGQKGGESQIKYDGIGGSVHVIEKEIWGSWGEKLGDRTGMAWRRREKMLYWRMYKFKVLFFNCSEQQIV